ncbi:hypothetical protein GSH19_05120 [Lactobacillus sp. S2-2]|uniref:hypothetical protein n=1 Tax=Lactobacillus sp. S2-2 TaxID=2692917 RepID=UPI001F3E30B1|nr:hypothetical protein [Lactobacillus sp. S2-2]MCF6515533.1 hypothetical protein [Lactobacillus sp. S2-2]
MANKRPSINDKKVNSIGSDLDTLFGNTNNGNVNEETSNEDNNQEQRLRKIENIMDYYDRESSTKQFSIYLPEEIQKKVKTKALEDDKTVSNVVADLIFKNYLTEEEIRSAYNKAYDQRNDKK